MVEIGYHGNVVSIGDEKVELPEPVVNVVCTDDAVLVHCDEGSMDPRNLVAYDTHANRLWRVSPLKESPDDRPRPVGRVVEADSYIHLDTRPVGKCYELDLETGEVEYIGWRR